MFGSVTIQTHPVFAEFATNFASQLGVVVVVISDGGGVTLGMPTQMASLRKGFETIFANKLFLIIGSCNSVLIGTGDGGRAS